MKKVLFIAFAIVLTSLASKAQDYKPFQLYLGLGYAIPQGGGGVLFDFEPAYRINDAIAVGLRLESAIMAAEVDGETGDASAVGSYTINGKYYLSDDGFRPYVGAGLGIYSIAAVSIGNSDAGISGESKFGFYPRVGFDLGHFNINVDYNIVAKTEIDGITSEVLGETIETEKLEIKNSYIGIRIGAFLFGGKK